MSTNKPAVIFIPAYIYDVITFDVLKDLANLANPLNIRSHMYTEDEVKRIKDILESKISKYDLSTFINFNINFSKNLGITYKDLSNGIGHFLYEYFWFDNKPQEYLDVINLLTQTTSMSDTTKKSYAFMNADNVLFVILHNGFSNEVINSKEGTLEFIKDIINSMFSKFNDEQVYSHGLFKKLLTTK